ncbi:hypothetical protein LUQ84_001747 [Hamiltosporidium tvaerminnensis]|nr:hypothetical protein LUQ84_001747 [Hamiltosporidium tvaerminnensis]
MEFINISLFKETCAYCYTDVYDPQGIMVCKCGISVCQTHKNSHLWTEEHMIIYFIFAFKKAMESKEENEELQSKDFKRNNIKNGDNNNEFKDLFVHSTILSPDEIYILEESLKEILSKNKKEDNIPYEDKTKCTHVEEIEWKGSYRLGKKLREEMKEEIKEETEEKKTKNENINEEIEEKNTNYENIKEENTNDNKLFNQQNIITKNDNKCTDCEITTNTWLCLSCGYIGCGRKQYGMSGNGHALNHNINTNHNIFVKIETIKGLGTGDCYCYKCDNYIYNEILENKLKDINFYTFGNYKGTATETDLVGDGTINGKDNICKDNDNHIVNKAHALNTINNNDNTRNTNINTINTNINTRNNDNIINTNDNTINTDINTINTGDKDGYLKKYVGIRNTGETCFISAALQMICNAIKYEEIDCEDHFVGCRKNPLKCFGCQFLRLIGGMKSGNKSVIFIDDLINVLRNGDWSTDAMTTCGCDNCPRCGTCEGHCVECDPDIEFGKYKKNLSYLSTQLSGLLKGQQDVVEFVEMFMSYLQEYENYNYFPKISKYFRTIVVVESYCRRGNGISSKLEGVSNTDDNTPVKDTIINTENNTPVKDTIINTDINTPVKDTISNTDINTLVKDTISNTDINTPVKDTILNTDDNTPVKDTISNTDINTPVKDTILNTDDNTPVKDSQYKCNYKPSIKRENIFIFSFPFKEKVSEGIKECFKESKEKCGCGGVITTRRSIINPALNMLLHVDRVILTDKGVIKVNDGLSVDKYDIGCYYKDISEFGVSNVKDIISTNNDERVSLS